MFPLDRRRAQSTEYAMLLPKLSFWLEEVVAWGMISAPSGKPSSFFSFLSKAKTAHPQHQHQYTLNQLHTLQTRSRTNSRTLIDPVSYKSPKRECSETFSCVLNHSGTPKAGKSFA